MMRLPKSQLDAFVRQMKNSGTKLVSTRAKNCTGFIEGRNGFNTECIPSVFDDSLDKIRAKQPESEPRYAWNLEIVDYDTNVDYYSAVREKIIRQVALKRAEQIEQKILEDAYDRAMSIL